MLDKYRILRAAEKAVIHRKFAQAIREYQRCLELGAEDPTILNTIGDLLLKQERSGEALGYFQRVADIYYRSGFALKAIAMYKKIHHLNPSDLKVNETLAELYQKQGLNFEAARHLKTLVERYRKLDQIGDAVVHLKQLVTFAPSAEMHSLMGELLEQRGEKAKAFDHYREALKLYLAKNRPEEAFAIAGRALEIDDTTRDLLQSYIEAGERSGRLHEVTAFFEQRIDATGQKFPFQMFLAWVREKEQQHEEAHRLYRELEDLGNYDTLIQEGLLRTGKAGEPASRLEISHQPVQEAASVQQEPSTVEFDAALFQKEEPGTLHFQLETTAFTLEETDEEILDDRALEESSTESAPAQPPVAAEPVSVNSLEEALQETDFYLKLGFREEAKRLLEVLVREYPGEERVLRRADKVMTLPPTIRTNGEAAAEPADTLSDFDLEIDSALDLLFTGSGLDDDKPDQILRYDIASNNAEEKNTPKTHYDLGLAYKEMGLAADAIQEFLNAFQMLNDRTHNPQRILCCSMLASSFLQLGDYEKAIHWAREGLGIPDKKDFEWKALQYDLATAFEKQGEPNQALDGFKEILQRDPDYRDVQKRIEYLEADSRA